MRVRSRGGDSWGQPGPVKTVSPSWGRGGGGRSVWGARVGGSADLLAHWVLTVFSPTRSLQPKTAPSLSTATSTLSPRLCHPATRPAPRLPPLPSAPPLATTGPPPQQRPQVPWAPRPAQLPTTVQAPLPPTPRPWPRQLPAGPAPPSPGPPASSLVGVGEAAAAAAEVAVTAAEALASRTAPPVSEGTAGAWGALGCSARFHSLFLPQVTALWWQTARRRWLSAAVGATAPAARLWAPRRAPTTHLPAPRECLASSHWSGFVSPLFSTQDIVCISPLALPFGMF